MSTVLDREAIDKFVIDALVDFGVDRAHVTRESSFDDLEVDSLDVVELSQAIKKVLNIQMRPNDFDTNETVGQILTFLYGKAGVA